MFYPINAFEPGVNKVLDDKCFRRLNIFLTQERKYSCYKKLGNVKFDAWLLALLRGRKSCNNIHLSFPATHKKEEGSIMSADT